MATTGRAVRLADVGRAAGVGTSIASRVLNGDPTVSIRPETRERILAAARELRYRPNAFARGLKLARTMTLGIIANVAYYHEMAEILMTVERVAADAGSVMLIADTADFFGERKEEGPPFVLLNRRLPGVGLSASVDDARGVQVAVEHLAALGHA